ncbi:MAG TPA: hypothetical protein ENG59_04065 [Chloroflexi bacterium]|nr:MAG: hypothetical protein DRI46_09550 [Chloroflexota bacterium]HDD55395.1 hypothetical protein [Chloroflexota bacterium]
MTVPAFIFSFLLASFLGAAFHFWKGGGGGRLLLNLILSWIGFYLGNWMGASWEISFLMIGPVSGGFGALGSLIFLFVSNWIIQLDSQ